MTQHSLATESDRAELSEEVPMTHDLHVTAASVTIIDRKGVRVPAGSIASVLRVLTDRKHTRPPVITVAEEHTTGDEAVFQAGRWILNDDRFVPYPGSRPPTYALEYADFVIATPDQGDVRTKSPTLAPVLAAARTYATAAGYLVVLESDLPGFTTTVIAPDHGAPSDAESTPKTAELADAREIIPPKPTTPPPPPPESDTATALDEHQTPWPRRQRPPLSLHTALAHRRLSHVSQAAIARARRLLRPSPKVGNAEASGSNKARTYRLVGVAAVVTLTAAGGIAIFSQNESTPAPEPVSATAPPITAADDDLLDGYVEAWTLPADKAETVSWFAAGVVHVDPDSGDLILTEPRSGDEISSVELDSAIEYTTEFMAGGSPAAGARTDDAFTAMTADGRTQSWTLADEDVLRASGTTPMLVRDDAVFALVVGEDKPVPVTGNPDLIPAAIDGDTLLQVTAGQPRVVSISRTDDADTTETVLPPPTPTAQFDRHLSAGHGLALVQWTENGSIVLAIHDTTTGSVTATVPDAADVPGWRLGRGMETLLVGGHAIDVATGEPLASTDGAEFSSAYGPAAVLDDGAQRTYIVGGHSYTISAGRLLGFDGEGLAVVRTTNGAVTTMILDTEGTP